MHCGHSAHTTWPWFQEINEGVNKTVEKPEAVGDSTIKLSVNRYRIDVCYSQINPKRISFAIKFSIRILMIGVQRSLFLKATRLNGPFIYLFIARLRCRVIFTGRVINGSIILFCLKNHDRKNVNGDFCSFLK